MQTKETTKRNRPRKVRISGNAPAEFVITLRRTPSLGFPFPKQKVIMKIYTKETREKFINGYTNPEDMYFEDICFFEYVYECIMSNEEDYEEIVGSDEDADPDTAVREFVQFCGELIPETV